MLNEAYDQGVNDALEYIEKVAKKTAKPGEIKKFYEKVKGKMKSTANKAEGKGRDAGRAMKKNKAAAALGLGAAGGAGFAGGRFSKKDKDD